MNILFLFVSLSNLSNERTLYSSLVNEFRRQGHNVLVSSKAMNSSKTEVVDENGISVLRIGGPEFTAVSNNVKKALAYQLYVLRQRYYVKRYWRKDRRDYIPFITARTSIHC